MQSQLTSTRGDDRSWRAANDNAERPAAHSRPAFPYGSTARIFRPGRSVMTSGRARTRNWHLVFERRTAPFVEPLMGWSGGDDPLTQVRLEFPTLAAAVAYAERQGLNYVVKDGAREESAGREAAAPPRDEFWSALWSRLHLSWFLSGYGYGASQNDPFGTVFDPASVFASPMDVVTERALTLAEKRAVLKNWAWNEYLLDVATGEGMPENGRPSRLDEVELALLTLEQQTAAANSRFVAPLRKATG